MPMPNPELIRDLTKRGFNPFAVLFNWGPAEDRAAAQKMFNLHETLEGKGIKGGHGWYLTGRRTMIVIGWTDSNMHIQDLCLSVTYGSGIQADVSHVIDVHDLASVVQRNFGKGG